MPLLELYVVSEMARTRGDPSWKVLDWAAKQDGDFTVSDAYRVYTAAGGQSGPTQFATIFNKWVAKYDPSSPKERYRSEASYGLSQERPIVITRQGRRGKGGEATYQWGLDGPLREPPPERPEDRPEEPDEVGDAIDRLEGAVGPVTLKQSMARWRKLSDLPSILRDVWSNFSARERADAVLVASAHLIQQGKADEEEVQAAEDQADKQAPPQGEPEATVSPFVAGRPKAVLPQRQQAPVAAPRPNPPSHGPEQRIRSSPIPPPVSDEPDDGAADLDQHDDPSADWGDDDPADKTRPDAANPLAEPEPGAAEVPDETGIDLSQYPEWMPQAVEDGTSEQQAMYRLVTDGELDGGDPVWDAMAGSEDDHDLRKRLMGAWHGHKRERFRDALTVGLWGLQNAFEQPDEDELDDEQEADPKQEAEPDDGGYEGDDADDPAEPEETQGEGGGEWPEWLPDPDPDSGSAARYAMFRIADESAPEGVDANEYFDQHILPTFVKVRQAQNGLEAYGEIRGSRIPQKLYKSALTVAKAIFAADGRDWETGEPTGPREGLLPRIFRIGEGTVDDEVPDPSRRGPVGVERQLPDYGMDEGPNLDPVDFAPTSGLARIMRVRGDRD